MWSALPLARSVFGRFVRAAAATAAAAAVLLTAAALVEGHPPRIDTLRAVVGPLAGALGAAWALGGWRRDRADVAAAALGHRGWATPLMLSALAAPLLMLAPLARDGERPRMVIAPDRVTAQLPGGPVEWRWAAGAIERRRGGGPPMRMPRLPAPRRHAPPPRDPSPLLIAGRGLVARLGALALLLGWLARGPAPGPPRVVLAATAAFVAGHGLATLVG